MKRLAVVLCLSFAIAGCSSITPGETAGPIDVAASPVAVTTASATESPAIEPTIEPAPSPNPEPTSAPSRNPNPAPTTAPKPSVAPLAAVHTLAQLIGQKVVVSMSGTTPSADLLGRIRRGEVGGVILFGSNITTRTALVALTAKLRGAAAAGGQPPLLIATDQEGGTVKRIPWAPPTLTVPQMGRIGLASTAYDQGARTGVALRSLGI
jgi:beta-N-acetylhexosaminidase